MNIIERYYTKFTRWMNFFIQRMIPFLRRIIRFLALPYAYIVCVNWDECKATKLQVFKDFIFIFFTLKDFPDYYTVLRLWEKDRSEWKYYYGSIYNPYQRGKLRRFIQKKEYEILFEDKYVCNQLCTNAGLPLPVFLGYIEREENLIEVLTPLFENTLNKKIIIKASRGRGGQDIFIAYKKNSHILIKDNNEEILIENYQLRQSSIIQRYIEQHAKLNEISPSINTIRTETLLTREREVLILGSFIRFGIDNMFLDNQCAGGLSIGVNIESGTLYDFAMNGKGEKFYCHPNTGFEFKGFEIPYWDEVIKLSKNIQKYFSYYKLLGPDIAITPQGPIIIEINATPDHAGLEMDYGPVFKDKKVWEAFKAYDLLINKPSKYLF